jgi:hypothetical protein
LDLMTAAGLSEYLAHTLHALARLPFDARVANSIGGLVNAARAVLETADVERRLFELEMRTGSGAGLLTL